MSLIAGKQKFNILPVPTVGQILVALFLVLPSFSVLSSTKNIPLTPIWLLLATLISCVLISLDRGKNLVIHKVDILIFCLITIDVLFFSFGLLWNGNAKEGILGLYREVGIYVPYFLMRSVYTFKGRKFFYNVLYLVFVIYLGAAILGVLQQFGLFIFGDLVKEAYKGIISNIDKYDDVTILSRGSKGSAIRSHAWLGSPLVFAQLMSTLSVLSWSLFLSVREVRLKAASLILFIILIAGLLSGLTRNYFLSLFFSITSVLIYNYFISRMQVSKPLGKNDSSIAVAFTVIPSLAILLTGVLLVSLTFTPSSKLSDYDSKFSKTIQNTFSDTLSGSDKSSSDHLEDILGFPAQVADHPFGGGLGSFGVVSSRFEAGESHLEGVWYAQILQRGIIVQFIVFCLLFNVAFSIISKGRGILRRNLKAGASPALYKFIVLSTIGILVNTFVSGFFLPDLYSVPNGCLIFGLLAFSSSVLFTSKKAIDVPTKQMSDMSA